MSNILKTQRKDYTKEMEINFFCILRRFINHDVMNKIINKVNYFNEKYEYDEVKNSYITNNKRRENSLYSDFGFEKTRMSNWSNEERDKMLDKYYNVKRGMGEELNNILTNVFFLLNMKQWRMLGITLIETYPGCNEQEIHIDMPGKLGQNNTYRYYLSIPLQDTDIKMGPIIYYKEDGMKEFRKEYDNNKDENGIIGKLNSLKWEIKQIFLSAREQYDYKLGDISIHRDITYNNGGTNNTNKIRRVLFVACDVRY